MSIQELVAGCPSCGSRDYTFTRLGPVMVELRCLSCDKEWKIEDPFTPEREIMIPSEKPGVYIVGIYGMAFAVESIVEAQKIVTYAEKLGYPLSVLRINYSPILNSATVIEELNWINAQEEAHEASDTSSCQEG